MTVQLSADIGAKRSRTKPLRKERARLDTRIASTIASPARAVDVVPYPIDWDDREGFYAFGGFVKGVASQKGIKIRWGGDWDSDNDLHDQNFIDLPHFELAS